jgi:hypothetical protein
MLLGRAMDFDKLKWTIRTHLKEAPNGLGKAPEHIGRFLHENGTALLIVREEIRNIWRLLTADLGLAWEQVIATPQWRKALLMGLAVLPQTGRVWRGMAPANLDWLRETLFEEALSEQPMDAILLRRPNQPFQPTPLSQDDDRFGLPQKAQQRAEELVAGFAWAK